METNRSKEFDNYSKDELTTLLKLYLVKYIEIQQQIQEYSNFQDRSFNKLMQEFTPQEISRIVKNIRMHINIFELLELRVEYLRIKPNRSY